MDEQQEQDKKIIIENRTELDFNEILILVGHVIRGGKISGAGKRSQYCYLTIFDHGQIAVSAFLNKRSHRFVVWNYPEKSS